MSQTGESNTGSRSRELRGRVAFWVAVLTAGITALAFSYDTDNRSLMPGPVTPAHRVVADCASCHSNIGEGQFAWVHAILKAADGRADNARCLACHSLGDKPDMPHGLPKKRLERLTESKQARQTAASGSEVLATAARNGLLEVATGAPHRSQAEITCSVCHGEHRNADSLSNAAANETCNACHQTRFSSFQNGHPGFADYPFRRRTRIKFDHAKHFSKNFEEARTKRPDLKFPPAACTDCHAASADGHDMRVKPFEQTCSTCHLPQIVGADRATGPKGIALLALPGLDLETLRERKAPVGSWPEESEAELTPLMRVLLARDNERRALLATIDKLDLQDLTTASKSDISAVTELVWEIKELLYELTTSKASQILRRVREATSGKVGREEMTRMLGTLPREVLISAQRDWLPKLAEEVARRKKKGWQKHFIAKAKAKAAEEDGDSDEAGEAAGPPTPPPTKLVPNPKGGRFYVSVLGEIVQEGLEPPETRKATLGEIEGPEPGPANSGQGATSTSSGGPPAEVALDERSVTAVDDETWSEFGGWYRKDYSILYRPSGHADRFIRAWIDVSAAKPGQDNTDLLGPVFELLSDKEAHGRCTKCHSVEKTADAAVIVGWGPLLANHKSERFTTFKHMPHFSLLDKRGCLTCHQLDGLKDFEAAYKGLDPSTVASSFKPVAKETCAKCHTDGAAPQDCGHCHTYHVTPATTPVSVTRLPVKAQEKSKKDEPQKEK